MQLVPLGFEQLPASGSAQGLPDIPKGATFGYIQCQDDPIRWRDDGTDPTAATGHRMFDGDDLWFNAELHKFRFITESGTPVLTVSYYKALSK